MTRWERRGDTGVGARPAVARGVGCTCDRPFLHRREGDDADVAGFKVTTRDPSGRLHGLHPRRCCGADTGSCRCRRRGFSLIEVMVAAAVLGLIAAGVVETLRTVARVNADARMRAAAAVEVRATLDRVAMMRAGARSVGASPEQICSLLEAAGAPMDATTGGQASGTCPQRTVRLIPTSQTGLLRTVSLREELFGRTQGLRVTVTVGRRSGVVLATGTASATSYGIFRP
jgi:prepilin-type N-terminal cleavage/methylation domain-containing protein